MLAKDLGERKLVDKVFATAKRAKEAMEKFGKENVTDATIGSLYDEDGKLVVFDTVLETYRNLPAEELGGYAPAFTGSVEYKESVKISVFGRDYEKFLEGHYLDVIATPGGTGAISNSVKNYLTQGDTLLLPKWLWSPYILMAKEKSGNCNFYTLFNEIGEFDTENFKNCVDSLAQKQENVVVIINDPCQNPTGYRLSKNEWKKVKEILISASQKANIILILDIAYIEFDDRTLEERREIFENFKNLPERILTIFTFSLSKALTVYGMRVGAQIALSTSKSIIEEFSSANSFSCRSTWSNIPRGAMKMFSLITLDEEKNGKLEKEREFYKSLIKERAEIFQKEAKECNLEVLPYVSGFFLTIPTGEYTAKVEELLEKNHIYTVVLEEGIRIALCSVPKKQIKGLAPRIKAIIDEAKR